MKEFVLSLSLAKSIENTISINIINFDNFFMIISFYLFYFLTHRAEARRISKRFAFTSRKSPANPPNFKSIEQL